MSATSCNPFEKSASTIRRAAEIAVKRNAIKMCAAAVPIGKSRRAYASFGHRGAAGCKGYHIDVTALRAKLGAQDPNAAIVVD